jgi:hypothetical protein
VDKPLEEVSLRGGARPPRVLERLVRREELAVPDQLEPALEVLAELALPAWYAHRVATILLAGVDLYFRAKLEALLPDHHLVTTDSVDPPDLVITDIARIEPDEVADAYPDVPILGFANHTDTTGLRTAHAAGFDQVVAKSALVERAPELVEGLTASVESGS